MKIRTYENAKIKSAFSVFVAFIPLISIYYSGIPGVNAADVILGLFLAFMGIYFLFSPKTMVDHLRVIDFSLIAILAFVLYVLIHAAIAMLVNRHDQSTDVAIRSARIVFYLLSAIVLLPNLLDTHIFIQAAKAVSVLASLFLLIQVLVYTVSGTVIRGFPSFLPLYSSEYTIYDYEAFYLMQYHRPTSFFLEPAHFSRYVAIVLPFFIKDYIIGKSKGLSLGGAVLITFSVLLSTSSIGMLLVGISWFIFILSKARNYHQQKNIKRLILLGMGFLAGIGLLVAYVPSIRFTLSRSMSFEINSAFYARLGSYKYLFNSNNSILSLIFGNGYGRVPGRGVWMADFIYIFYGAGIVGTSCIVFAYISLLQRRKKSALDYAAMLVSLILLFVDDSFNSIIIVFILGIHYSVWENKKRE